MFSFQGMAGWVCLGLIQHSLMWAHRAPQHLHVRKRTEELLSTSVDGAILWDGKVGPQEHHKASAPC
jgi:hypothetical protein